MSLWDNIINKTLNPDWPNGMGDSDHHLVTIYGIALQIKAKNILELGVRGGTTTEPLALAAFNNRGMLTSVDKEPIDCQIPYGVHFHWNPVQSDSIEFLKEEVKKGTHYDLIYVDDWHEYSHVKHELMLIEQLIDNKSIILLHDLMAFTEPEYHIPLHGIKGTEWGEGGPTRAVFELDKNIWEWATIPINNGLTILRKI